MNTAVYLQQPDTLTRAKEALEKEGFWIYASGNTERYYVLDLADQFGTRQSHAKSNPDGSRNVTCFYSTQLGTSEQQYAANATDEFTLHTDGTFLEGIAKTHDDKLILVSPPKIMLLQMVQPAAKGGASTILDAQPLLENALHKDPELVKMLMQPSYIYSRDDQFARAPVIGHIAENRWSIRWRYDFATLTTPETAKSFNEFYKRYISDPQYIQRYPLQPGDVLMTDNLRVLHGRDQFSDDANKPRLLRRVWVADAERSFINPLGKAQYQKVYNQYQGYSYVNATYKAPAIEITSGIRLSPASQAIAAELFKQAMFEAI